MRTLKSGSAGPTVQLLQLALRRAGFEPGATDGVFGPRTRRAVLAFQRSRGLAADGVVGSRTWQALSPWYLGYETYRVQGGDSIYKIAISRGSTVTAVETANPGLDPLNLRPGTELIIPLSSFAVTPLSIDWSAALTSFVARGLAARYPFMQLSQIGSSVMGKALYCLKFGEGQNRVIYSATHHANEWLTTPMLFDFAERLAEAYMYGGKVYGIPAADIYEKSSVYMIPCVNPDGVDLVTGELTEGPYYDSAAAMAREYEFIPFPSGWKANIRGVDLNLQYPADWERARQIKFAQGYRRPGPRDYVGSAPLVAPESRAMYDFTRDIDPALILAYHTQGEVIYWRYLDFDPPRAVEIGELLSRASGYTLEDTPYASGFAGYKDWFILQYNRPGYTVEAGQGDNPLPLSQLPEIIDDNLGVLALAAVATADNA